MATMVVLSLPRTLFFYWLTKNNTFTVAIGVIFQLLTLSFHIYNYKYIINLFVVLSYNNNNLYDKLHIQYKLENELENSQPANHT